MGFCLPVPLPDDRSFFCHTKMRYGILYSRNRGLISGEGGKLFLAVFSLAFFAVVLFFSLRPGEIMTWIGKVMNPLFLAFLAVLVIRRSVASGKSK